MLVCFLNKQFSQVVEATIMEKYTIIEEVGNGTFGNVWRAISKQSGEVVAIKKMKKKYYSREECVNLREVKSLRKMNHKNIVRLKEVTREHDILYFVFEYMQCNLYELMDCGNFFSEAEVRSWCFQVFQGLAYMHQHGYFHRDLKPENLLVSKDKDVIKIADFGLAREINSEPPFTEYVSTRWYRAPEVLLQSPVYGAPVDMWAMGAIMSELFTLRPLFPGSNEADEIYKICCVLGSPTKDVWPEGLKLANAINYRFPHVAGVNPSLVMPGVCGDAVNLITSLSSWNPYKRPTALEALQHPFFQSCYYVPPSLRPNFAISRTPYPAGARGCYSQQENDWKRMNSFSSPKPSNSFSASKIQTYVSPGVQRKLNFHNQDGSKSVKNMSSFNQQPRYRPPGINTTAVVNTLGTDSKYDKYKLSNLKMSPRGPLAKPSVLPLPAMKAGGWQGKSDLQMHRSQDAIPGNAAYIRKVAG